MNQETQDLRPLPTHVDSARRRPQIWQAVILVGLTFAYNAAEAVIALWTAFRDHSLSLEAFGIDSIVELGLAAVLLWRLVLETRRVDGERVNRAERTANWWAGVAFYGLSAIIVANSAFVLWTMSESDPGLLGIGLAATSVLIMPVLATAKKRIGLSVGSSALVAEANCTWVCFYMSCTLLGGLAATRFLGWWWADPLSALGIVYWAYNEGKEAFERSAGKSCCGCGHPD